MGNSDNSFQWKLMLFSALLGVFGSIAGAAIGGITSYYASYELYQKQQALEQRNVAQALYIDILDTSNRFNESLEYLKLSTDDKRKLGDTSNYVFYDPIPYYSSNGKYFVYIAEINKFDSDLSRDLDMYYMTVMDIEYKRQYIADHYSKTFDYENLSIDEKRKMTVYNQNIIGEIHGALSQANKIKYNLDKK